VTVAKTVPTSCPGDQDCDTVPDGIDNCPAIANTSQADSEAPVGAVALYRFEELSGATVEDSVGDNAGLLRVDAARTAAGASGKGLALPTENSYVSLPGSVLDGRTDVTFETWIKTSDSVGAIVSGSGPEPNTDNEYTLYYQNGSVSISVKSTNGVVAVGTLHDNVLHHLAWVRSVNDRQD
jgi:hypothetical protein